MMRFRGSIFFKLFGILILTGVLLNALFYFAFTFFARDDPFPTDLLEAFRAENLSAFVIQIGNPPDLQKMRFIAANTGAQIRIETGTKVWQTQEGLMPIRELEMRQRTERRRRRQLRRLNPQAQDVIPETQMPTLFDIFKAAPAPAAFIVKENGAKYAFYMPDQRSFAGRYSKVMTLLMLVLTFLIASAYFAIHYILLPLNSLIRGVHAVGAGDLAYRVPVKGGTEFAELGASFNLMVERIKETLEAKERLLIDVSHELQSPLARMKLAIELMGQEKAKDRLKSSLKDLEAMVAEILESARLDSSSGSLAIQTARVDSLIREFLDVYELMNSPVHLHTSETELLARIDPSRFIVVMRNLIENALKHADTESRPKRVDVYLSSDPKDLMVEVKDNGRALATDEMHRIFEPFYRLDKSRARATGGYGLGLSLCKRIVDAHGGRIGIRSDDSGTTVWFSLPRGL
jgi:signal transduction histidine kinase